MSKSLCWKTEYTELMRELAPNHSTPDITHKLNDTFGTSYTKEQIGGVRKRLGSEFRQTRHYGRLLTDEQHHYFVANHVRKTSVEFAKEMNEVFGLELKPSQIKTYRSRNKLDSKLTGYFEKGNVPHNKGKKYPNTPPNSGQFKKGNKPKNYQPVGAIRYTTDGYPKIKVADPNVWEYLHRRTWEEHNGPIPKGSAVVFLNGDKTNWDISNLACLTKNEVARMNQNHLFSSDAELTKTGIGMTKLTGKIREVENER